MSAKRHDQRWNELLIGDIVVINDDEGEVHDGVYQTGMIVEFVIDRSMVSLKVLLEDGSLDMCDDFNTTLLFKKPERG